MQEYFTMKINKDIYVTTSIYAPEYRPFFCRVIEECGWYEEDEYTYTIEDLDRTLKAARELWFELEDVPIDDAECIDEDWYIFDKGTSREYIWLWFEKFFHVSVAEDLMDLGY